MSTTIAITLADELDELKVLGIREIAQEYGYDIAVGLGSAEEDVLQGIGEASETIGWLTQIFLKTPEEGAGVLAFGVQKELLDWETKGTVPPFFGFLECLDEELKRNHDVYWVVFASEWCKNDRIRLEEGSLSELVEFLKKPGNWYQRLYVVSTGRFQDSDEVPLVFKVIG